MPIDALSHWRLQREFRKRAPWVSRFRIAGRDYGGELTYENDRRIRQFFEAFPDARMIVEPGCLEGALTFQLARQSGSHVTGIDARSANLERARFVQATLGVENVRFVDADLEATPLASFGHFDAVFCSGLLYHLPRPWAFLDGLPAASPRVLLWTHYAREDLAVEEQEGFRGFWRDEHGIQDPRSGVSPRSFFITLPAIVKRLREGGFTRVEIVDNRPDHDPYACVTLTAEAPGESS